MAEAAAGAKFSSAHVTKLSASRLPDTPGGRRTLVDPSLFRCVWSSNGGARSYRGVDFRTLCRDPKFNCPSSHFYPVKDNDLHFNLTLAVLLF